MLSAECMLHIELCQPRKEASLISELRSGVVVGMASLPVRKNHNSRARLANYPCNLQSIGPGIFHPAIRDVECFAPGDPQNLCRSFSLSLTIFGAAAGPHLAAG